MKNESSQQDHLIPDQYLCPITRQVMQDPVVIQTGRSYQRKVILQWFGRGRQTDPFTNQMLPTTKVIPNLNLKQLIQKLPQQKRKVQQLKDYQYALKVLQQQWGLSATPKGDNLNQLQEKEKGDNLKQLKQQVLKIMKQYDYRPTQQLYQAALKYKQISKIPAKISQSNQIYAPGSRAFFDITLNGRNVGRIIFQLYDQILPKTTKNFKVLCTRSKPEGYKGSIFHRVITNFMAQGGDFQKQNGIGGKSIYGKKFQDQNFVFNHDKKYVLSMANAGKDTNGSQFFITFINCPWLDGRHVVFGRVAEGQAIVDMIQKQASSKDGKTKVPVVISDCGLC